ncbi:transposase [Chitinophaga sp. GCM10012297]|uniref:Transposase n=1 Tax=Chitinophaga chungangae TaxID=2821488 RepID=A0ABS3YC76_9BACT|nr:hypothetical protein [Chitinophaga chungangae]MBO9152279.1 hypothetical protein [Chitinophaga chungangae]
MQYLTRAEIWLGITVLLYFLMNGAQVFETAVLVPKWTTAPPENFGLLADRNGVSLKVFWIVMHSVHEVAFILALIFCWKVAPVRNWMLLLFVLHMGVRVWTLAFFAPNIIRFQEMYETKQFAEGLVSKTQLWQMLNYVRVAIYIAISVGLLPLLGKLLALNGH